MEWKYSVGDVLYFNCTDSLWKDYSDVRCKVIRRLTDDEADFCETGPMYELDVIDLVTLRTGPYDRGVVHRATAFEDELTPKPTRS